MYYSAYDKENVNLRQYIIWIKGYDPNKEVNKKMNITRHNNDDECIKNGIIKFLRKEKLLKLNVL